MSCWEAKCVLLSKNEGGRGVPGIHSYIHTYIEQEKGWSRPGVALSGREI